MDFTTYLQKEKASKKSIQSHLGNVHRFENWLEKEGLSLEVIHQKDILAYLRYCKQKATVIEL